MLKTAQQYPNTEKMAACSPNISLISPLKLEWLMCTNGTTASRIVGNTEVETLGQLSPSNVDPPCAEDEYWPTTGDSENRSCEFCQGNH